MQIRHIAELFALEGTDFLTEAYLQLLNRAPDEPGLRHYQGRLAMGDTKASIIYQLSTSNEYTAGDGTTSREIAGLKTLLLSERRARHWFWSFCRRNSFRNQSSRELRQAIYTLVSNLTNALQHQEVRATASGSPACYDKPVDTPKLPHDAIKAPRLTPIDVRAAYRTILRREPENQEVLEHHLSHDSLHHLYKALIESEEYRERNIPQGSVAIAQAPIPSIVGNTLLSPEDVAKAYREILGREPESAAAINHHIHAASATALRQALMASEEFQAPFRALPTQARNIFFRLFRAT